MTHDPEERGPANSPQKAVPAEPTLHLPTTSEQRTAQIMGAWFLGTFLFSIPAFFFYGPILNEANFIVGRERHPGRGRSSSRDPVWRSPGSPPPW